MLEVVLKQYLTMSSPPKKKKAEKFQLDSLEKAVIRRCVHQFHIDYKTSPTITLKKIHQVLIRRIKFGGDKASLRKILHSLGFRWKKTEDYKKMLIEKDSIRAKRPGYLNEIANYRAEGRPIVFTIETFINNPDLKLPSISEDSETIQVVLESDKSSEVVKEVQPDKTVTAKLEEARKAVLAMLESSGEISDVKVEEIERTGDATLEESDKSHELKPGIVGENGAIEAIQSEAIKTTDTISEDCEKVSEAKLEASTPEIPLDAMLEESERNCEAMLEEYDKRNRDTAEMPGEMTFEAMLAETSGNVIEAAPEAKSEDTVKSTDSEEDALEKIIKFTLEKISKPIACTSRETGETIQCTSKETGEPFVCTSMKMCKSKSISKETGEPIESTSADCAPPTPIPRVTATHSSPKDTDKIIEATLEEIFKESEVTQEDRIIAESAKTEETSLPVEAKSEESDETQKSDTILQSTSKGTDKATEIKDEAIKPTSTSADTDKASEDPISNISRLNVVVAVGEDLYSPNSLLIYEAKPKATGSYKTSSKTYERWLNDKLLPKLQPKSVIVVDMDSTHNKETNCVPSWYTSTKAAMEAWLTKNNISFVSEMCRAELYQLIRMNKKDHVKEYLLDKVLQENGHVVLRRLSNHQDLNPLEAIWSKVQANISPKLVNNFNTKSIRGVLNEAIKEMVKKHWVDESAKVKEREEKYMEFEYIMDDITDEIALLDEDQSENCSHSDSSSDTDMFCELDSDDDWGDIDSSTSASGSSYTSWDDLSEEGPKSTEHLDPSDDFFPF